MWTRHDYDDYPGWTWLLLVLIYLPFLIWALVRRWPIPAALVAFVMVVYQMNLI